MPRRKVATNCEIRPWLSAKADCKEGRFLQIGNSLLLSPVFTSLSDGAKYCYFCMAMESGGQKTFTLPRAKAIKYGISPRSLARHVKELAAAHLISVRSGKVTRTENEYTFEYSWKNNIPQK